MMLRAHSNQGRIQYRFPMELVSTDHCLNIDSGLTYGCLMINESCRWRYFLRCQFALFCFATFSLFKISWIVKSYYPVITIIDHGKWFLTCISFKYILKHADYQFDEYAIGKLAKCTLFSMHFVFNAFSAWYVLNIKQLGEHDNHKSIV